VNPVQIDSDTAGQCTRLQVLQLQPLVMLVLIDEQIELHLSVTEYELAFTVLKLDVQRLTARSNIKSYYLFPDRVTILR
jgi:hypothetical protein